MTEKDIMEALGDIKEEYIEEADPGTFEQKRGGAPKLVYYFREHAKVWSVMAAAVVLLVSYGIYRNVMQGDFISNTTMSDYSSDSAGKTATSNEESTAEKEEVASESASNSSYAETAEAVTDEASTMNQTGKDAQTVEIYCNTMAEAEKIAGFSLVVDEPLDGYELTDIYAIEDRGIEVCFANEDRTDRYWIRKAWETYADSEDWIKNDATVYDVVETWEINGVEVMMKGDGMQRTGAEWQVQGYVYTVRLDGISLNETEWEELIRGIE